MIYSVWPGFVWQLRKLEVKRSYSSKARLILRLSGPALAALFIFIKKPKYVSHIFQQNISQKESIISNISNNDVHFLFRNFLSMMTDLRKILTEVSSDAFLAQWEPLKMDMTKHRLRQWREINCALMVAPRFIVLFFYHRRPTP